MFRIKTTYYALTLAVTKPAITAATRGIITAATKAAVWVVTIAATLLAVACSRNEVVTTYEQEAAKPVVQKTEQKSSNSDPMSTYTPSDVPIIFDTADATTRALTTEDILKQDGNGFGVFAYYTHGTYPTPTNTTVNPNFMYNQLVYWDTDLEPDAWNYAPTKYWPNDISTGAVDTQTPAATGSNADKLSFFAYGPYANQVTLSETTYTFEPSSGRFKNGNNYFDEQTGASGILGFKSNSTTSDPKVHYRLGSAASQDLVYATALKDKKKLTDDVPPSNYTPSFAFSHALAALKFYVGAYFDETPSLSPSIHIADDTYITIESVEISSDDMPYDGWLNLNSGNWEDTSSSTASITVDESELNTDLQYTSTDTAEWDDDEGIFVKTGSWHPGVGRNSDGTKAAAGTTYTLMKQVGGLDQYAMIMPSATSVTYKITCNYHVWTLDKRNADCISKVENNVTNEISFTPAKGNVYAITIWLGMTTVKLDVKQYNNGTTGNEHWPTSAEQAGGNNIMWN